MDTNAKVIIVNAIPVNNGDAALVNSLYNAFLNKGIKNVKISTPYLQFAQEKYPELPWIKQPCSGKIFTKLPWLRRFALPITWKLNAHFNSANVIVGAPGGYVNSYYNPLGSMLIFRVAKKARARTAIYSQSYGPFKPSHFSLFKSMFSRYLDVLVARDKRSLLELEPFELTNQKVIPSIDAAFLAGNLSSRKETSKKVAFSVRDWKHDHRNSNHFYEMIKKMAMLLIDKGYTIEFISTCQGIPGYVNDSNTAQNIANLLGSEYQNKVVVNNEYFELNKLKEKLHEYDFVIGTRLHFCILSLIEHVPAFNISYEFKGKECYSGLNFEKYSVDYNEDFETAIRQLEKFEKDHKNIAENLPQLMEKQQKRAIGDFEMFIDRLS